MLDLIKKLYMGRPKKVVAVEPEVVAEVVAETSDVCANCENSGRVCSVCHFDPHATEVL